MRRWPMPRFLTPRGATVMFYCRCFLRRRLYCSFLRRFLAVYRNLGLRDGYSNHLPHRSCSFFEPFEVLSRANSQHLSRQTCLHVLLKLQNTCQGKVISSGSNGAWFCSHSYFDGLSPDTHAAHAPLSPTISISTSGKSNGKRGFKRAVGSFDVLL